MSTIFYLNVTHVQFTPYMTCLIMTLQGQQNFNIKTYKVALKYHWNYFIFHSSNSWQRWLNFWNDCCQVLWFHIHVFLHLVLYVRLHIQIQIHWKNIILFNWCQEIYNVFFSIFFLTLSHIWWLKQWYTIPNCPLLYLLFFKNHFEGIVQCC